jgi:type II secretory pathway component PulK
LSNRRGVALIAALWLVVAIGVVSLQFALDARERRMLGLHAADGGRAHAAALGALAEVQQQLDVALSSAAQNRQELAGTRAADPWMGIDSIMSEPATFDSIPVDIRVRDLGAQLNINTIDVDELRTFLALMIGNYTRADQLAQTITDWRDLDDTPQQNGEERDGYLRKGLLALPANGPFARVDDLLQVEGMTPDILARLTNDLDVYGPGTINLNTAPVELLRSVPGITDDIVANILTARSRGLRIASVAQVVPGAAAGRGGRGGNAMASVQLQQLTRAATVTSQQLLVTVTARPTTSSRPARVTALLQRNGQSTSVSWVQW